MKRHDKRKTNVAGVRFATRAVQAAVVSLMITAVCAPDVDAQGAQRGRLREWLAERRASSATASGPIHAPGDYRFAFLHGGLQREYLVHVPHTYRAGTPTPLVLALHGGGGGMDYMARDDLYGLKAKSDEAGFIAVFPNGVSPLRSGGMLATWNAGNCCAGARDRDIDDVGFLRAVVERVSTEASVDRNRVFAIGMSNGGMMAYRMACEAADLFRGIMSVAGTDNTQGCQPSRPVAVLHIHARNDDHVLFNGGAGAAFRNQGQVTDFVSVPATIAKWVRLNGAAPPGQQVLSRPGAMCELHAASKSGAPVELCVTDTGGHSWPGGSKPRGETPSQAIRANDVMWDFFSRL